MHDALRLHAPTVKPHTIRFWQSLITMLALWRLRSRSRRHLAWLDDRALADIGLGRAQQWQESRKRFWQA